MQIDIVSVFPEYFRILNLSLLGKAQQDGLIEINSYNLRDWTHDVHRSVDDTPVGGGAGMVMKPEVWAQCLDELLDLPPVELGEDASRSLDATADLENMSYVQHSYLASNRIMPDTTVIFPDPSAPLFTQKAAQELSSKTRLVFGCGRYEGIDARVGQYYLDQGVDVREYSIGDYVLNGGEVAVCAMVEAITRLIPGFMGNPDSIKDESYTGQPLLEYRQFTRPTSWRGLNVPEILTSGNHARVDRERRNEKLARTSAIRPDLIEKLACSSLDRHDRHYLQTLGWDVSGLHPRRATRK